MTRYSSWMELTSKIRKSRFNRFQGVVILSCAATLNESHQYSLVPILSAQVEHLLYSNWACLEMALTLKAAGYGLQKLIFHLEWQAALQHTLLRKQSVLCEIQSILLSLWHTS